MTDEELIERLRAVCTCNIDSTPCMAEDDCRDALAAAARIEQLVAANEALLAERKKDHANINLKADFIDKTINQLAEADAKLAKAVEAVDKAAALIEERHVVHMTAKGRNPKDYISEWSLIAKEVRATLAELKGETHDPL